MSEDEIDMMYSIKLGNLAFDIENGCAVRFRRIMPVPIPEWDCQADEPGGVDVTCCACGHRFCPGCADKCPACGSKVVIRDQRWDEEAAKKV